MNHINLIHFILSPCMLTIRLIFSFYRSFVLAAWLITLLCMIITYTNESSLISTLFWFKVLTSALFLYFLNTYKSNEYYYYKNLGISKLKLWISSISIDLIIFILLQAIILKIK
jgi:hypothetical protein